MINRGTKWLTGMAALAMVVTVAGCGAATNNTSSNSTGAAGTNNTTGGTSGGAVTINETGSSLLYPLFNGEWISAYQSVDPNVKIVAGSTGSGAGISQAIAGTVQIGASDAYMADAQMQQNPSIVNIPVAISAQQIMYNLPGVTGHLKLTGNILAQIYTGKIKYWDDAQITKLNPGVKLPHQQIIPIHRSDGSGDTFLFSQFLSDTNSAWQQSPGYGTSISWPSVSGGIGAKGNEGVVADLASNKYSIGYVGISWLNKATKQGIGYAALQNKAGNFVLPTQSNIQSAASALISKVPADERISLIYAPGANSYPIINFEYTIINTKQPANMAAALKKFLNWAIDPKGGNSAQYLKPVHFLPLPASIEPKSQAQINKIGG
ncbi:phosphate ABC transporter substrate-binding protein PstS [Alicyclobacillus tolerans]|uniref:phosphate ABC transporter substrate-binding protein PstS n=1 Tax=Alicyclobacillus tolerans TaxID=90970 RepID=UPI001F0040F4|nr:phosphate ABC transporter substrate-binding protein PstS [Alicyclobacillus tolerans]MCF8563429.1 phosphate ABC transporter substrate-binding protein PstS [Alicyclobacillus tolerans]